MIMRSLTAVAAFLLVLAGCALAQPQPQPQSAVADKALTVDSPLDDILDALDARGQGLNDFAGTVTLTDTDTAARDAPSRTGTVVYQKKPGGDARILVRFTKRQEGNRIFDQQV